MTGAEHDSDPADEDQSRILVFDLCELDDHDTGAWHPERPDRLRAVSNAFERPHLVEALRRLPTRPATRAELEQVHQAAYLDGLMQMIEAGGGPIDADTHTSPGSWQTATHAAGAALEAVDALENGLGDAAFVAVRPPGHHATSAQAMGFCLLNNAAVAAATLRERGQRVAIIDWDVHHGNGTQDIFWHDPDVLYASLHEYPAYPGTGRASEVGEGDGRGTTVNVPLPHGAGGIAAMAALDEIIGPAIDDFDPDWLIVSAGYDAHRADPLADLHLSTGDFALLTERVLQLAPPGRRLFVLEGGYDLDALAESVTATLAVVAGVDRAARDAPSNDATGREAVRAAAARRREALLEP